MASAQTTGSMVGQLMATVMQLSPDELRDFKTRFQEWQKGAGEPREEEAVLVEACHSRLSDAALRRLKALIGKSERGALSAAELKEYRDLVRRSEKVDAVRLASLAELARRWRMPVQEVMSAIGWEDGDGQTARHSSRSATSRPQSRR